jgi:2-keto-4-pentenoate hydratase
MTRRIYNGPQDRQPKTITNRTVNGALLPGTAVFVTATQLNQATSVMGGRIALLADRDFYSAGQLDGTDPLKTPYASGDTGVAYELEVAQRYSWAMAAGTYTNGQELTIGAAGRLLAAVAGDRVVAHFDGPGATLAAGDLADVAIANFYTKT